MIEEDDVLDFVAYKEQKEKEEYLNQIVTEEYYEMLSRDYHKHAKTKRTLLNKLSKAEKQLKQDKNDGRVYAIASTAIAGVAFGAIYGAVEAFKHGGNLLWVVCAVGAALCAGVVSFCAYCSAKSFKSAMKRKTEKNTIKEEIEDVDDRLKCVHQQLETVAFYLGKDC